MRFIVTSKVQSYTGLYTNASYLSPATSLFPLQGPEATIQHMQAPQLTTPQSTARSSESSPLPVLQGLPRCYPSCLPACYSISTTTEVYLLKDCPWDTSYTSPSSLLLDLWSAYRHAVMASFTVRNTHSSPMMSLMYPDSTSFSVTSSLGFVSAILIPLRSRLL